MRRGLARHGSRMVERLSVSNYLHVLAFKARLGIIGWDRIGMVVHGSAGHGTFPMEWREGVRAWPLDERRTSE